MNIVTTEIEGIRVIEEVDLENTEEIIAAQAVITTVEGSNHPLVDPESPIINIARALRENDIRVTRLAIHGVQAEELVESLEVVACLEDDQFRNQARYMLNEAGLDAPDIEPYNIKSPVRSTDLSNPFASRRAEKAKQSIRPPSSLLRDQVELYTIQHRATAIRVVSEFADEDLREQTLEELRDDVRNADEFGVERSVFEWPASAVIIDCLEQAALRKKGIYDDIARLMLDQNYFQSIGGDMHTLAA